MKDAHEKSSKVKLKPSNDGGSFLQNFFLINEPSVRAMISIPHTAIVPSRVIQLLNMISPEDLFDDEIYTDLFEDVKGECEKFGSMEHLEIKRPHPQTGMCTGDVGKVFIKFHYIRSAKRAQYKLNGRPYNRRTCIASFYPEDEFEKRFKEMEYH
jgi:splicing factor U2AF subunit